MGLCMFQTACLARLASQEPGQSAGTLDWQHARFISTCAAPLVFYALHFLCKNIFNSSRSVRKAAVFFYLQYDNNSED